MDPAQGYALAQQILKAWNHRPCALPRGDGWEFRDGHVLNVLNYSAQHERPSITITAGIATETPVSTNAYVALNEQNSQLMFGRIFLRLIGPQSAAILLQEIIPLVATSWDYPLSIEHVHAVVNTIVQGANSIEGDLRSLGGRPFNDREGFLVGTLG